MVSKSIGWVATLLFMSFRRATILILHPAGREPHVVARAVNGHVQGKILVNLSMEVSVLNVLEPRKQRAEMWKRLPLITVLLHVRAYGDSPVFFKASPPSESAPAPWPWRNRPRFASVSGDSSSRSDMCHRPGARREQITDPTRISLNWPFGRSHQPRYLKGGGWKVHRG